MLQTREAIKKNGTNLINVTMLSFMIWGPLPRPVGFTQGQENLFFVGQCSWFLNISIGGWDDLHIIPLWFFTHAMCWKEPMKIFHIFRIIEANGHRTPLTYNQFQCIIETMDPPPAAETEITQEILQSATTPLVDDHEDRFGVPTLDELGR